MDVSEKLVKPRRRIRGKLELNGIRYCYPCGDTSWAMNFSELMRILIHRFASGKKLLLKGNHYYWWETQKKLSEFASGSERFHSSQQQCFHRRSQRLRNTGWIAEPNEPCEKGFEKRGRETSSFAWQREKRFRKSRIFALSATVFQYRCDEIMRVLAEYGVKAAATSSSRKSAQRCCGGSAWGINFTCVSSDYVDFKPVRVFIYKLKY